MIHFFRAVPLFLCSALLLPQGARARPTSESASATPPVASKTATVPDVEDPSKIAPALEVETTDPEGESAETWFEPEASTRAGAAIAERRVLAYASTAVAALAFGTGITIGYFAREQFSCLQNVLACNETLATPIEGSAYLDQVAEVEQKAVLADMMFVLGAASTVVAVTNWVQGFWSIEDEQKDARALTAPQSAPLAQHTRGARP